MFSNTCVVDTVLLLEGPTFQSKDQYEAFLDLLLLSKFQKLVMDIFVSSAFIESFNFVLNQEP